MTSSSRPSPHYFILEHNRGNELFPHELNLMAFMDDPENKKKIFAKAKTFHHLSRDLLKNPNDTALRQAWREALEDLRIPSELLATPGRKKMPEALEQDHWLNYIYFQGLPNRLFMNHLASRGERADSLMEEMFNAGVRPVSTHSPHHLLEGFVITSKDWSSESAGKWTRRTLAEIRRLLRVVVQVKGGWVKHHHDLKLNDIKVPYCVDLETQREGLDTIESHRAFEPSRYHLENLSLLTSHDKQAFPELMERLKSWHEKEFEEVFLRDHNGTYRSNLPHFPSWEPLLLASVCLDLCESSWDRGKSKDAKQMQSFMTKVWDYLWQQEQPSSDVARTLDHELEQPVYQHWSQEAINEAKVFCLFHMEWPADQEKSWMDQWRDQRGQGEAAFERSLKDMMSIPKGLDSPYRRKLREARCFDRLRSWIQSDPKRAQTWAPYLEQELPQAWEPSYWVLKPMPVAQWIASYPLSAVEKAAEGWLKWAKKQFPYQGRENSTEATEKVFRYVLEAWENRDGLHACLAYPKLMEAMDAISQTLPSLARLFTQAMTRAEAGRLEASWKEAETLPSKPRPRF